MAAAIGFAFGPYQLDLRAKTLRRGEVSIDLPIRCIEVLGALVSHAGRSLSKDELIKVAWGDTAVGDNSLAKVVSLIRATLDPEDHDRYISTLRGRGYRFVSPAEPIDPAIADRDLDAMLEPHRILIDGRAALETLGRDQLVAARTKFAWLVQHYPHEARFHVGLATACAFWFQSTRADLAPDYAAAQVAVTRAREACRLDPGYAAAWFTLGFSLLGVGAGADALAAHARAVTLDPDHWQFQIGYAHAAFGEDRLVAVRRALKLMPGLAIAHWLAAQVHVGRGVLDQAERDVDEGLIAMSGARVVPERFAAIGLHWLKGLLCRARGAMDEALAAFEQEAALESRGHFYGREMAANNWCAIGACHLEAGDHAVARDAFEESLQRVTDHALSRAGLAILNGDMDERPWLAGPSFDHAVAAGALRVARGAAAGAADLVTDALSAAPPGATGWRVPIEPLLHVERDPATWANVLAIVSRRSM